jgi:hypothetical protein
MQTSKGTNQSFSSDGDHQSGGVLAVWFQGGDKKHKQTGFATPILALRHGFPSGAHHFDK